MIPYKLPLPIHNIFWVVLNNQMQNHGKTLSLVHHFFVMTQKQTNKSFVEYFIKFKNMNNEAIHSCGPSINKTDCKMNDFRVFDVISQS
jgi:hypothetical protein